MLNSNDGTNPPTRGEQELIDLRSRNRAQAEALTKVAEENTALRRKVEAYEAGQEPYEPGVMWGHVLNRGQLWHRLLTADENLRMGMLGAMLSNADDAKKCFEQDHGGRLMELEALREQLSVAVFGSLTLDSMQQLIVGVRALRQVIVDGIAARSTIQECELTEDVQEQEFGDAPNPLAVIDEGLEKAGIDRNAECRYQVKGWGDTEDEWCADTGVKGHLCGLVDPMHASAHMCRCGSELSHEQAEALENAREAAPVLVTPGPPPQTWAYGPNALDPDPAKRWHVGCGGEVLTIDGADICGDCGFAWGAVSK